MGSMLPYIAAPWIRHGYYNSMTSQLSMGHGISQILSHLTMTAMFHLLPENLHGKGRVMLQQVQVLVVFIPAGDGLSHVVLRKRSILEGQNRPEPARTQIWVDVMFGLRKRDISSLGTRTPCLQNSFVFPRNECSFKIHKAKPRSFSAGTWFCLKYPKILIHHQNLVFLCQTQCFPDKPALVSSSLSLRVYLFAHCTCLWHKTSDQAMIYR